MNVHPVSVEGTRGFCLGVPLQASVSDQGLGMLSRESGGTFEAIVVSKKGRNHGMSCC